jgi:cell division protein FtsL
MKVLLMFILLSTVFVSAIEVVLAQHKARKYFVEIQEQEKQQDKLNEEWGKLQLEQSTWATDDRVEKIARINLEMTEPDQQLLVLIVQ